MKIPSKSPRFWALIYLISLVFLGIIFGLSRAGEPALILDLEEIPQLVILQENTLVSLSNPANPEPKVVRILPVIITAYSSTSWQTDDDPHITAAGTQTRDGVVANNLLYFGTKLRIPEIFGDKIFVVEDRMNWKKGNYHIDVWFPDYWQALNFGAKRTFIEVLES